MSESAAYKAKIVRITESMLEEIPGYDRVVRVNINGQRVIVSSETKPGDLGVYFSVGSQLSHEYVMVNSLYRKNPDTGENMGGYLDPNRRIRSLKICKTHSEGLWVPVDSLSYTGKISHLEDGDFFNELNGKPICKRFVSEATKRYLNSKNKTAKAVKPSEYVFNEHFSTEQVRDYLNFIPKGAVIRVTLKMHGTSARTGHVLKKINLNKLKKLWNKYMPMKFPTTKWEYVTGTRRTVLNPDVDMNSGYYGSNAFRFKWHEIIKQRGLEKGITLYYELVGFYDEHKPIMPSHTIKDKELKKKYGDKMLYKYGCVPQEGENKAYLYRATSINEDGVETDLSWPQLNKLAKDMMLPVVPELCEPIIFKDKDQLLKELAQLADGPDPVDNSHIREGVVLKIEHPDFNKTLKWKGFWFTTLEGIKANENDYVDPEDLF